MTNDELKEVFSRKRRKIERKTKKRGDVVEKVIDGFETISLEQFVNWFNIEEFNRGCNYCGITNAETKRLYDAQIAGPRMDGTRGGKRGKRLELDRRDPREHYDNLNNLVWCCYWCNNAKSNFFTETEFRPIGLAIGTALRSILQNID